MTEWQIENEALVKVLAFADFTAAVKFVSHLVPIANEMNHHPDVQIFAYNKVKIILRTHETGTVTKKDHLLAQRIDELLKHSS